MRAIPAIFGFAIGCYASIAGVGALLDRWNVEPTQTTLDMAITMRKRIETIPVAAPPQKRVLLLGDSTVTQAPAGKALRERLQQELDRLAPQQHLVISLADPGLSAFDYYPTAERMAEAAVDTVVIGFNPKSFSSEWRASWTRRELYGWTKLTRLPELVTSPVYWWDVTLDSLLLHKAIVDLRYIDLWQTLRSEQARINPALESLRDWAQDSIAGTGPAAGDGMPAFRPTIDPANKERFDRHRLEGLFLRNTRAVTIEHPMYRLLGRVVDAFRARGTRVLLVVVPVNMEHMRKIGVPDLAVVDKVSGLACRVARERGGACIDLHDDLGDDWFADPAGHYRTQPMKDGLLKIAREIAPAVAAPATH